MKNLNFLLTTCWLSLLLNISCVHTQTATFDSPQPTGIKDEYRFDKKFLGSYQSSDSSTSLIINDQLIIQSYNQFIETLIDSLHSYYVLSADTLINNKSKSREIVIPTDSSNS